MILLRYIAEFIHMVLGTMAGPTLSALVGITHRDHRVVAMAASWTVLLVLHCRQ